MGGWAWVGGSVETLLNQIRIEQRTWRKRKGAGGGVPECSWGRGGIVVYCRCFILKHVNPGLCCVLVSPEISGHRVQPSGAPTSLSTAPAPSDDPSQPPAEAAQERRKRKKPMQQVSRDLC